MNFIFFMVFTVIVTFLQKMEKLQKLQILTKFKSIKTNDSVLLSPIFSFMLKPSSHVFPEETNTAQLSPLFSSSLCFYNNNHNSSLKFVLKSNIKPHMILKPNSEIT